MKQTKKSDEEPNLITINKVKKSDVSTYIWSELEEILVGLPIEFKSKDYKRSQSGTLIITYGAIYIFKNKLLSEYPPRYSLSLLDALKVEAFENSSMIILTFPDIEITVKTKHCVPIVKVMAKIVAECTYGLSSLLILPRFTISHEKREYDENGEEEIAPNEKSQNKKDQNKKDQNKGENLASPEKTDKDDKPSGNSNTNTKKVSFEENLGDNDDESEKNIPLKSSNNRPLAKLSSYFYNDDIQGRVDIDDDNTHRIRMSDLVKSRPKDALIKRILLLAHFYDIPGQNLDDLNYFRGYEKNPTNSLTVGPQCRPGKFAYAYGHGIGWESKLDKVIFLHFKPMRFGNLLEALLINSANINRITFADYKESTSNVKKAPDNDTDESGDDVHDDDPYQNKRRMMEHKVPLNMYIPDFSFSNVKKTKVRSFFFHDCAFPVVEAFLEACQNYTCPIEEFAITNSEMKVTEIFRVLREISSLECFMKLQCLGFLHDRISQFPIDQLPSFLSVASCLENLVISDVEADGSQILAAVCNTNTPLKILKLTSIQFHTNYSMGQLELPAALFYIDFTKSSFSAAAFKGVVALITGRRKNELIANVDRGTIEFVEDSKKIPTLMVKMTSIILNKDGYESFKDFDYSAMRSNIVEFDWSNNKLPSAVVPFFFKFLNTQKQMRILVLNNIRLEKQALFFKKLTQYVMAIKLPGIDMTARLYKKFLFDFYDAMKNQPFIRRFCVVGRGGGDDYIAKYTEVIKTLPNLTEVKGDGFLPRNLEFLLIFWRTVFNSQTIKANDFPVNDISFLWKRCSVDINVNKFKELLGNFKSSRVPTSYQMQRADFIISNIRKRNEMLIMNDSCPKMESDFFIASCSMPWIDSTPQALVNEVESEQKKGEAMSILVDSNDNDNGNANIVYESAKNSTDEQQEQVENKSSNDSIQQKYVNAENDEFLDNQNDLQEELIQYDNLEDDLEEEDE